MCTVQQHSLDYEPIPYLGSIKCMVSLLQTGKKCNQEANELSIFSSGT